MRHRPHAGLGCTAAHRATKKKNEDMDTTQLTFEVFRTDVPSAIFVRELVSRALPYVESFRWPTDLKSLFLPDCQILIRQKTSSGEKAVVEFEGCVASIAIGDGFVGGQVAGTDDRVAGAIERLKRLLPPVERDGELVVPITFWRMSEGGAESSRRKIVVSPWGAVQENYPLTTRRLLDAMIGGFRPGGSGRLLLWYGEPGTGKTHALRSLAWEWRDWCRLEYVVDPEKFFGDSDYLMRVLLEDPEEGHLDSWGRQEESHWRLLALEDAGELVASDARDQVGQRLSRLLNTVDGLLGEGLRLLVLITTNEDLTALHPAVARFGRCAAEIEFAKFGISEANQWGRSKGVMNIAGSSMSLAELFAAVEEGAIRSRPRSADSGLYL